jgi:hypothetical protein
VENAVSNQMNTQFSQDNNIVNTVNGTVQNEQNIQGTQNISQVVSPQPTSVEYSPVQQSPVVQQNPNIQQIPSA